jgi:hypothetical protein
MFAGLEWGLPRRVKDIETSGLNMPKRIKNLLRNSRRKSTKHQSVTGTHASKSASREEKPSAETARSDGGPFSAIGDLML